MVIIRNLSQFQQSAGYIGRQASCLLLIWPDIANRNIWLKNIIIEKLVMNPFACIVFFIRRLRNYAQGMVENSFVLKCLCNRNTDDFIILGGTDVTVPWCTLDLSTFSCGTFIRLWWCIQTKTRWQRVGKLILKQIRYHDIYIQSLFSESV